MQINDHIPILPFLLFLFCIQSCANPVSPTGGPQDLQPPRLVPEKSAPAKLTNFDGRELRFEFDEFIDLKDPYQQIIITPEPEFRPEYIARGKTFILRFDSREQLDPNTTYSIQFGGAIADFTEGNKAETLRYVFSTGAYIDSLQLNVQTVENEMDRPVPNTWVMLYEGIRDSAVFNQRPYYFTKTDSFGMARLQNLKEGEFTMVALNEQNGNYFFDQPSEEFIGFYPENSINPANVDSQIRITIFREQLPVRLALAEQIYPGKWNLALVGDAERLEWPDNDNYTTTVSNDSLQFWIRDEFADTLLIKSISGDTFYALAPTKRSTVERRPPVVCKENKLIIRGDNPGCLHFNQPVIIDDSSAIFGIDTSGNRTDFRYIAKYDSLPSRVCLRAGRKMPDTLKVEDGGFISFLGDKVRSFSIPVDYRSPSELSSIMLRINGLDSSSVYVLKIFKANELFFSKKLQFLSEQTFELKHMEVATYEVEIFEDLNRNGIYDLGNYISKRLPEPVQRLTITRLRPNWDQEVIFQYDSR